MDSPGPAGAGGESEGLPGAVTDTPRESTGIVGQAVDGAPFRYGEPHAAKQKEIQNVQIDAAFTNVFGSASGSEATSGKLPESPSAAHASRGKAKKPRAPVNPALDAVFNNVFSSGQENLPPVRDDGSGPSDSRNGSTRTDPTSSENESDKHMSRKSRVSEMSDTSTSTSARLPQNAQFLNGDVLANMLLSGVTGPDAKPMVEVPSKRIVSNFLSQRRFETEDCQEVAQLVRAMMARANAAGGVATTGGLGGNGLLTSHALREGESPAAAVAAAAALQTTATTNGPEEFAVLHGIDLQQLMTQVQENRRKRRAALEQLAIGRWMCALALIVPIDLNGWLRGLFVAYRLTLLLLTWVTTGLAAARFFDKSIHVSDANTANANFTMLLASFAIAMTYTIFLVSRPTTFFERLANFMGDPQAFCNNLRNRRRSMIASMCLPVISAFSLWTVSLYEATHGGGGVLAYFRNHPWYGAIGAWPLNMFALAFLVVACTIQAVVLEYLLLVFHAMTRLAKSVQKAARAIDATATQLRASVNSHGNLLESTGRVEMFRDSYLRGEFYELASAILRTTRYPTLAMMVLLFSVSIVCLTGLSTATGSDWPYALLYMLGLICFAHVPTALSRADAKVRLEKRKLKVELKAILAEEPAADIFISAMEDTAGYGGVIAESGEGAQGEESAAEEESPSMPLSMIRRARGSVDRSLISSDRSHAIDMPIIEEVPGVVPQVNEGAPTTDAEHVEIVEVPDTPPAAANAGAPSTDAVPADTAEVPALRRIIDDEVSVMREMASAAQEIAPAASTDITMYFGAVERAKRNSYSALVARRRQSLTARDNPPPPAGRRMSALRRMSGFAIPEDGAAPPTTSVPPTPQPLSARPSISVYLPLMQRNSIASDRSSLSDGTATGGHSLWAIPRTSDPKFEASGPNARRGSTIYSSNRSARASILLRLGSVGELLRSGSSQQPVGGSMAAIAPSRRSSVLEFVSKVKSTVNAFVDEKMGPRRIAPVVTEHVTKRTAMMTIASLYGVAIHIILVGIVYIKVFRAYPWHEPCRDNPFAICRNPYTTFLGSRVAFVLIMHMVTLAAAVVCFPRIWPQLACRALVPTFLSAGFVCLMFALDIWTDYVIAVTFVFVGLQLYDSLRVALAQRMKTYFEEEPRSLVFLTAMSAVGVAVTAAYCRFAIGAVLGKPFGVLLAFRVCVHPVIAALVARILEVAVERMQSLSGSCGYVYYYWAGLVLATIGRLMMYQSTSIYEALLMNGFIGLLEYIFRRSFNLRRELLARASAHSRRLVWDWVSDFFFGPEPTSDEQSRRLERRELEIYASHLNVLSMVKVQSSVLALVIAKGFAKLSPCYSIKGAGDEATDIVNLILMLAIGYLIDFVSTIWEQGQRIDVVGDIQRRPMLRSYMYLGLCVLTLVHLVDFSFLTSCPVQARG